MSYRLRFANRARRMLIASHIVPLCFWGCVENAHCVRKRHVTEINVTTGLASSYDHCLDWECDPGYHKVPKRFWEKAHCEADFPRVLK